MQSFVKININDSIKIKLRPKGEMLIATERARLQAVFPGHDWTNFMKPDADGYLKMQIWTMMEFFGPHTSIGCDSPIETDVWIAFTERPQSADAQASGVVFNG